MMIAVAAEFKQQNATYYMIAVPAMPWHGPFIFARSAFFSCQPVVFNVVDGFEQ
jgi:hypothetical protein